MNFYLGLDGGGTKTEAALIDETGRLVAQTRGYFVRPASVMRAEAKRALRVKRRIHAGATSSEAERLVHEADFDDAYTFRYSPREGTGALRLPDPVPDDVAGGRLERLIGTVRAVARRRNAGLVGTVHEVLVEKVAKRGRLLQTRTRTNKVVLVDGPTAWIGTYAQVRLTGTTGSTFTGVPVQAGRELAILG